MFGDETSGEMIFGHPASHIPVLGTRHVLIRLIPLLMYLQRFWKPRMTYLKCNLARCLDTFCKVDSYIYPILLGNEVTHP